MVFNKARKLLGLLHRRLNNAPASTLFQLYLVRPHLEYASPVWSPHLAKDKELIEGACAEVCVENCKQELDNDIRIKTNLIFLLWKYADVRLA